MATNLNQSEVTRDDPDAQGGGGEQGDHQPNRSEVVSKFITELA